MEDNLQPRDPQKQEDLISDYVNEVRQMDLDYARVSIRKARNALFFAAALLFASELLSAYQQGYGFTGYVLLIALVESGVFVALALWTRKKPYSAIIGGIIAFIGVLVLAIAVNAYTDGLSGLVKALFGGVLVKVIILVLLFRALGDARTVQQQQNEPRDY
ncbi:hypothetical protein [Taibaiella chishuiensis]|uniref:Uncharacterized protein n=1 Tax=Taibaiella chishuiensis TaxID=1434707 RepID=A0A2P8D9I5_9BACT|nr:hypothetical protein [Taibaiella chishuiensis]PSK93880.1 hypothetical protein B0I18_10128 [Taibaiella chishuiensis]